MSDFIIGCHLSKDGGYTEMGKRMLQTKGLTFQYFTKNPQGKSINVAPSEKDIIGLTEILNSAGARMPLAHAPYTHNPCSSKPEVVEYSHTSMRGELANLEMLPGSMYNFHPGCHVGQGIECGISMIADLLNDVLWEGMHTTVLLETMAGKGSEVGSKFEELREIIDRVDDNLRPYVGVCLDTCHVNDAGYDIAGDPDGVLSEFDRIIGLDRLHAVHLNDSKNPLGSHKDRHEKIGLGTLGADAVKRIINHPVLEALPFFLETPCDLEGYTAEIAMLKEWRKN